MNSRYGLVSRIDIAKGDLGIQDMEKWNLCKMDRWDNYDIMINFQVEFRINIDLTQVFLLSIYVYVQLK